MREIVHIQAGQCGNQIGAKVRIFYPPHILEELIHLNARVVDHVVRFRFCDIGRNYLPSC